MKAGSPAPVEASCGDWETENRHWVNRGAGFLSFLYRFTFIFFALFSGFPHRGLGPYASPIGILGEPSVSPAKGRAGGQVKIDFRCATGPTSSARPRTVVARCGTDRDRFVTWAGNRPVAPGVWQAWG